MELQCELNGEPTTFEVAKTDLLLDVLRRHGYTGAKRGCDTGACGMCMVQVDGEATQSCVFPASRVDGASVETIEGLGTQDDLHPIQQAYLDHTAMQCGFCTPGFIMSTKALLEDNPEPSEAEIREGLSDNLCRCTGYQSIIEAVADAAERTSADALAADGGEPSGASRGPSDRRSDGGLPLDDLKREAGEGGEGT